MHGCTEAGARLIIILFEWIGSAQNLVWTSILPKKIRLSYEQTKTMILKIQDDH